METMVFTVTDEYQERPKNKSQLYHFPIELSSADQTKCRKNLDFSKLKSKKYDDEFYSSTIYPKSVMYGDIVYGKMKDDTFILDLIVSDRTNEMFVHLVWRLLVEVDSPYHVKKVTINRNSILLILYSFFGQGEGLEKRAMSMYRTIDYSTVNIKLTTPGNVERIKSSLAAIFSRIYRHKQSCFGIDDQQIIFSPIQTSTFLFEKTCIELNDQDTKDTVYADQFLIDYVSRKTSFDTSSTLSLLFNRWNTSFQLHEPLKNALVHTYIPIEISKKITNWYGDNENQMTYECISSIASHCYQRYYQNGDTFISYDDMKKITDKLSIELDDKTIDNYMNIYKKVPECSPLYMKRVGHSLIIKHVSIELMELHLVYIFKHLGRNISFDLDVSDDTLTECQQEAISFVTSHNVCAIVGEAGTGKSTVLQSLYGMIVQQTTIQPIVLSFTGKAVGRLKTGLSGGIPIAMTIHRFIYWHDLHSKLRAKKIILIIDEASMISLDFLHKLLCVMNTITTIENCRFIFIGDIRQLSPIHGASALDAYLSSKSSHVYYLNQNMRAVGDGFIITENARKIAYSNNAFNELVINDSFIIRNGTIRDVCDFCKNNPKQLRKEEGGQPELLIITAMNDDVSLINRSIQAIFIKENMPCIKRYNEFMYHGDRVVQTKNVYQNVTAKIQNGRFIDINHVDMPNKVIGQIVYNGQMGILQYNVGKWQVLFDNGQTVDYKHKKKDIVDEEDATSTKDFFIEDLTLAYAMTVHKCQGSESMNGIFFSRKCRILTNSLIYTAITRFKKNVLIINNENSFENNIRNRKKCSNTEFGSYLDRMLGVVDMLQ